MKRLLFLAFGAAVAGSASLASLAACDPSLDIAHGSARGDGGDPAASTSGGPGPAGDDAPGDEAGASDEAGSDGGAGEGGATGHQIDGMNDFTADQRFVTTSSADGYEGFVSWDAKNVYFGMLGADVSATTSNPGSKWVMVYLGMDGTPGTTTGLSYSGVQQPTLPFSASYNLRWKIDGSFPDVQKWNDGASAWQPVGALTVPLVVGRAGDFMEMSIPLSSIGSPSKLRVHMNMLIEGNSADWTYAGVPSTSFTDMKNPMFTKYFEFDMTDVTTAPNSYVAKP